MKQDFNKLLKETEEAIKTAKFKNVIEFKLGTLAWLKSFQVKKYEKRISDLGELALKKLRTLKH